MFTFMGKALFSLSSGKTQYKSLPSVYSQQHLSPMRAPGDTGHRRGLATMSAQAADVTCCCPASQQSIAEYKIIKNHRVNKVGKAF